MYDYFLIVAICLTIFGIVYTYFTYRNKERLALIESGLDLEFFKKAVRRQNNFLLAFGIIFIGFSLGILSGFFFEKYLLLNFNPKGYRNYPQAYLSMVTAFMGTGMLISFFIIRRINKNQQ